MLFCHQKTMVRSLSARKPPDCYSGGFLFRLGRVAYSLGWLPQSSLFSHLHMQQATTLASTGSMNYGISPIGAHPLSLPVQGWQRLDYIISLVTFLHDSNFRRLQFVRILIHIGMTDIFTHFQIWFPYVMCNNLLMLPFAEPSTFRIRRTCFNCLFFFATRWPGWRVIVIVLFVQRAFTICSRCKSTCLSQLK